MTVPIDSMTKGMKKKPKKIVVLGGAGLVGGNLVAVFLNDREYRGKFSMVVVDKNKHNLEVLVSAFPPGSFKALNEDVTKQDEWQQELKGAFAVVQLQAQIGHPTLQPFIRNNIESVKRVLTACKKAHIRNLIHISSSVVISVANDHYTTTKRTGEDLVNRSGIPHTILRPPLMFGTFDSKYLGWLTRFMKKLPLFYPIPGSGRHMRQPLYVEDFARIIARLVERNAPENKIYNIIGRERIDFIDLMRIIAEERGMRRVFVPIPIPVFIQLVRVYGLLNHVAGKKPMFIPDELRRLIAGDDFPVTNWWDEFNVSYTPFRTAVRKTVKSPYDKYSKMMLNPN